MERALTAELLDSLPAAAPEARRSRRDLRRINAIMGNERWFRRVTKHWVRDGEAMLEIGAGDGTLGSALNRGPLHAGLDLAPRPAHWPAAAAWHRTDARAFTGWGDYPVICGNLIFHHFSSAELTALGQCFNRHARVVLASEPARAAVWQWGFGLLCPLLRASPVTRHDGRVSIAAGFRGDELPRWLGLTAAAGWKSLVRCSPTGAYRLVAIRS